MNTITHIAHGNPVHATAWTSVPAQRDQRLLAIGGGC